MSTGYYLLTHLGAAICGGYLGIILCLRVVDAARDEARLERRKRILLEEAQMAEQVRKKRSEL